MTWAITGTGMVSSLGATVASSFEAYCEGATSLHGLRAFDESRYRVQRAYELDDRPPGTSDVPWRASRWLCEAVRQAVGEAGLIRRVSDEGLRVPVLVGTGLAEQRSLELWWTGEADVTAERLHFGTAVEEATGLQHTLTIVNACAASLYALAVATDLLSLGEADAVVVAGADAISESMFGLLDRVNMRPPDEVRPFDSERVGVILGEGAAAVVVEPLAAAARRRAAPLATLRGVGTSCDAHHVTAPLREGVGRAFRDALHRADRKPEEIDLVLAHGTGTPLNDLTEAQVLGDVFGGCVRRPLVTALKSLIGHTSGGSGIMSLVTALAAMAEGRVPPTRHHATPMEEIRGFHVVTGEAHRAPLQSAQVNAFGFGGVNAVAVLEREPERGGHAAGSGPPAEGGSIVVTGAGIEMPGVPGLDALTALVEAGAEVPGGDFDPAATLGRRGLRYKDRATLLGLCAAHRALEAAGLERGEFGESCGVVASTDLALVDTVCRVVDEIHGGGVVSTSPMDLPNASGNVAAAQIAIWFDLRGLNLTISSGPTSGVDAVHHAAAAIRAGRAERMLVVGVEPAGEAACALLRHTAERHGDEEAARLRPFEGAVALVLEEARTATRRGAEPLARLGGYRGHTDLAGASEALAEAPEALWAAPCRGHDGRGQAIAAAADGRGPHRGPLLDVSATTGEASAAYGVVQCAVAAARLAGGAERAALVSAGGCWGGRYSSILLRGAR